MAKVYRPSIASIFPKSAEFLQPPLEYTEKKKDGATVYEPKERKGKIDFHSEKPFLEGSAVTSASTYEHFVAACRYLQALQQLVSNDEPPFANPPKTAFPLPRPVSKFDWPFLRDATVVKDTDEGIKVPTAPDDPSKPLVGWEYGFSGPVSYIAYHLLEGSVVADMLGSHDAKNPYVATLPYVPRLLAADPGATAFIASSQHRGSGDWVPCLSPVWDEDQNPSPTDADVVPSERTYADLVSDAFHRDPGSSDVADILLRVPDAPDYPGPATPSANAALSLAGFDFTFPTRAVPMWLGYFAKCLDGVRCVFGGTMRPATSANTSTPPASARALTIEPVRVFDDGEPDGWPLEYTTKTGGPAVADSSQSWNTSILFRCLSDRPGSGTAATPGSKADLGCYSSDTADAEVAAAVAATSVYRGVPADSAVCVRAGDASVLAKHPDWLDLELRAFLYVTADYREGGDRELSDNEDCSHESLALSDQACAYIPVSFTPSEPLTERDGSGKVVWVPAGSVANLVSNALAAVTGTGIGGVEAAPHAAMAPPEVVSVNKRTGDGYDPSAPCFYTEDTAIHTELTIGVALHCPHVLVPAGFFYKSALDSST